MKKGKNGTPVNRRGFHSKNNTQIMGKLDKSNGKLKSKLTNNRSGLERMLANTMQETPSGEQGLPDVH